MIWLITVLACFSRRWTALQMSLIDRFSISCTRFCSDRCLVLLLTSFVFSLNSSLFCRQLFFSNCHFPWEVLLYFNLRLCEISCTCSIGIRDLESFCRLFDFFKLDISFLQPTLISHLKKLLNRYAYNSPIAQLHRYIIDQNKH